MQAKRLPARSAQTVVCIDDTETAKGPNNVLGSVGHSAATIVTPLPIIPPSSTTATTTATTTNKAEAVGNKNDALDQEPGAVKKTKPPIQTSLSRSPLLDGQQCSKVLTRRSPTRQLMNVANAPKQNSSRNISVRGASLSLLFKIILSCCGSIAPKLRISFLFSSSPKPMMMMRTTIRILNCIDKGPRNDVNAISLRWVLYSHVAIDFVYVCVSDQLIGPTFPDAVRHDACASSSCHQLPFDSRVTVTTLQSTDRYRDGRQANSRPAHHQAEGACACV